MTFETCIVGSTGLVGSRILSTLRKCSKVNTIHSLQRRDTGIQDDKVKVILEPESGSWPTEYPAQVPIFFSALGTTARQAGGFAQQRKIDFDLNVGLAEAAHAAGATVYVLISTSGASPSSRIPYSRMKGELDEAVKGIGFSHTIVLKPGLLVGERSDSRPGEFAARKVATYLGYISGNRLKDSWAQDAGVVARAAVVAALDAIEGRSPQGVRVLDQGEIVRLGRTEWDQRSW